MRTAAPLLVVLLLAASCASPAVEAAERQGRDDALRDIAAGAPRLVFIGQPGPWAAAVDRKTGLPIESIGCCPSYVLNAYRDAYNDATRDAVSAGRIAATTPGR